MRKKYFVLPLLIGLALSGCGQDETIETSKTNIKVNSIVKGEEKLFEEAVFLVDAREQNLSSSRILFAEQDYFYSSLGDNNRIYRAIKENNISENTKSEVSMLAGKDLIYSREKIYYSNSLDNNKIYSFLVSEFNENTKVEAISKFSARDMTIVTDGFFYINEDDNEKIYFLSDDGSVEKAVTQDRAPKYIVANDILYYQNAADGYKLYAIDLLEKTKHKLTDFSVESFVSANGFILTNNSDDNNNLYLVKTSENIQKISNTYATNLKINLYSENKNRNEFYYIDENSRLVFSKLSDKMKIEKKEVIYKNIINDYYLLDNTVIIKDNSEIFKKVVSE
ncbi:MAG: DUF5050 domain-containing protein [Sarcina sp.]